MPPQMPRPPAQGLADANPTYVCGVGMARARPGLINPRPGRGRGQRPSLAVAAGTVGAGGLLAT
jgi:hypothetical protein